MWWYGAGFNTSVSPSIAHPTTDLTHELANYPRDLQLFRVIYPPTRQIAFLQAQPGLFRIHGADYDALPPNLAGAYGLEDVRGYHSLYPARYNRLARLIDGKDYRRTSEGNVSLRVFLTSAYERPRLLDMLNVEYLIFPPGSTTAARYPDLELVHESDEGRIYRNPRALPRAWLVYRVETIPDDDARQLHFARCLALCRITYHRVRLPSAFFPDWWADQRDGDGNCGDWDDRAARPWLINTCQGISGFLVDPQPAPWGDNPVGARQRRVSQ